MNWTVIIIETIILTAAFMALILIPLVGPGGGLRYMAVHRLVRLPVP